MNQIKRECETWFLKEYSFSLAEDWLVQCIEWLTEEFPNKTVIEYRQLIFKQLIDFDLTDIGTKCLPECLFNSEVGSFQGRYLLQVCYCIDTTQSYYSHIQKAKGDVNENVLVNTDDNPFSQFEKKSNRMLAIDLTDGVKIVKAMEFQPIRNLSIENLKPGTKVELCGRINYCQSVLLLSPENIKIIGGQVDSLSSLEAYVDILSLKLDEKKSDTTSHEKIARFNNTDDKSTIKKQPQSQLKPNQSIQPYQNYKAASSIPNTTKPTTTKYFLEENILNKNQNFKSIKEEPLISNAIPKPKLNTLKSQTKIEMDALGLFDEEDNQNLSDDDDEFLALIEMNSFKNKSNKQELVNTNKPTINTNNNEQKFNQNNNSNQNRYIQPIQPIQPIKRQSSFSEKLNQNLENSNKKPKSYHSTNDEITIDKKNITKQTNQFEVINDDDDDDYLLVNNILKLEPLKPKPAPALPPAPAPAPAPAPIPIPIPIPTIKIDQLNYFTNKVPKCCLDNNCVHLVRGFVRTLTAPLKKIDMKWYQKCLISDGKAHLEVYIDDAITSDFMQLTCKQAKDLFQKSREDPTILKVYENKANLCAQKLAHISCIIHLKYDKIKSEYCIIKLEDINDNYFDYLISKVRGSKLFK